jgi:hypothetical protein
MILFLSALLFAALAAVVAFLARPASWTPEVELVRVSARRRSY